MKKLIKKLVPLASALSVIVAVPAAVSAQATTTGNTTVNANLGSTISMSTSGTVNLAITPVSGGAQTNGSDSVSVSTNNSTGYTLQLNDQDTNTSLVKGTDTIAAHTGTVASPTALANNSWGYRVDGAGGFGAGPTTAESNATSSAQLYAGITASGSPVTLKTTSAAASGSGTTVWYAAKADTSKPSGTYSDIVTYTATANP